jgi:hypothetical protein
MNRLTHAAVFVLGTTAAGIQPAHAQSGTPMNQLQYRATHNSYWLGSPPNVQIDDYNVWEVEIDFGYKAGQWRVGHDGPQPKHGLDTLASWLANIASSNAHHYHPIFIKLEAKNKEECGWPTCENPGPGWAWAECKSDTNCDWPGGAGGWARDYVLPIIEQAFGDENTGLFTPIELAAWRAETGQGDGAWPPMEVVRDRGPFVVHLFDHVGQTASVGDHLFIHGFGLPDSGVIGSSRKMAAAIRSGAVRFIFDYQYALWCWSSMLMHQPLPSYVDAGYTGYNLGTNLDSHASVPPNIGPGFCPVQPSEWHFVH